MRLRITSVALSFLLMATTIFGADITIPDQKIIGGEKPIPLGELVDLSLSPIQFKSPSLVSSSAEWKVVTSNGGKEQKIKSNSEGVFFSSGTKNESLIVYCFVTHLYVVKDGTAIKSIETRSIILRADLAIGDGKPFPGPQPPTPTPVPNVILPDGKYKVSQTIYNSSMQVASNNRVKAAKALSASFKGVSAAIAAGVLSDPEDILRKTKESNLTALVNAGIDKKEWEAVFKEFMEVSFNLYEKKVVTTAGDFKDLWNEVAIGFEAVK